MMWRIFTAAFLCGLAVFGRAEQAPQAFERTISRTVHCGYLLNLPDGYRQGSGKKWPVILFLHGSGECGDDLKRVAWQGIPRLLSPDQPLNDREREAAKLLRESFIVVSPQCPANTDWDGDTVMALLDEVLTHRDADPARVYLTGLSLGGFATWTIGLHHPERFAALVPVCGGGSLTDADANDHLKGLAIWAFHGAQDTSVPFAESQRMIDAVRAAGVEEAKLTIYPDAEHNCWARTYADPDLYRWLLWHHR